MARAITAGELTKLRTDGQTTRLYLVVDIPAVVFKARINQSFSSLNNVTQITYDTVTAGAFADILPDMTLYVGTTEGAYDVGMCRIRKAASATVLYIGATSDVDFADNYYLTVVDEYAPWAKQAETDDDGVVTMDTDIEYDDQHENCDPVPVMGPDAVKWLSGATVDVDWDGSDSWVIGASISSHSWAFPSASGTADTGTATPTATYNATGRYLVADTVTADNGASFIGRRNTYIIDADTSFLTTEFTMDELVGTRDDGGWTMRIVLYDQALRSEIRDRAKIILFARDWYSSTEESLGPVADREEVVFIGWVAEDTIYYNPNVGSVEFVVMGSGVLLQHIQGKPVLLTDTYYDGADGGVPTVWTEFQSLVVDDAIWHIAHWRSTVTRCMDLYVTDETAKQAAYFSLGRASIYEQMIEAAQRVFAMPISDRYGRLFVEIDPQMVETGDRGSIPVVMTITEADWRDEIEIYRNELDETALVEITGTYYSIGTELTFGGRSPGDVSKRYGEYDQLDDIMVESQLNTNTLAGLYCGWLVVDYPETTIFLAANNRFFDIAPQQYGRMSIAEADTERGIVWTNQDMIPRSVEYTHNPGTGVFTPVVIFEQENSEENSVSFFFPGSSGYDDGGGDIPPGGEPPPEPPPFDPPLPIEDPPTVDDAAYVLAATASAIKVSTNFNDESPTWDDKTGAISGTITDVYQDVTDETRNTCYASEQDNGVYKTTDLLAAAPTWDLVFDAGTEFTGLEPRTLRVFCSPVDGNYVYALVVTRQEAASNDVYVYVAYSSDAGVSWNYTEVDDQEGVYKDYTLTAGSVTLTNTGAFRYNGYVTHARTGSTPNPWGMAYSRSGDFTVGYEYRTSMNMPAPEDSYINNFQTTPVAASIPVAAANSTLNAAQLTTLNGWITSEFGAENVGWVKKAGVYGVSMPFEAQRTRFGLISTEGEADCSTWVFWNDSSLEYAPAMDIGKHNAGIVYVGTSYGIKQSTDGGTSFTVWIPDAIAYDIECQRGQDANDLNIKYWDEDGKLWYPWRTTTGIYRYEETEANKVAIRIASDPVLGIPTFIMAGTASETYDLILNKQPYSTVHDTKQTGISNARGMVFYRGSTNEARKLFYLDSTGIRYSVDYGDTILDKTGDFGSLSSPVRIFPLLESNEAAA